MALLERNDETCKDTWEVVRMLSTNKDLYVEILTLSQDSANADVDWKTFFESKSIYLKTYMQEIIQSVLEENDEEPTQKRIQLVEITIPANVYATNPLRLRDPEEEIKRDANLAELRLNWTKNFLNKGGFDYIMSSFIEKEISKDKMEESEFLCNIEFLLSLMRVFLTAAFSTDKESDISEAVAFVRRSSSVREEDVKDSYGKECEEKED